ncbi:MAG: hypothetical protein EXR05_06985 [Acetobacteraceae bacterium]|nr:hypothetical protein [Acetobacteraceae bacterium]
MMRQPFEQCGDYTVVFEYEATAMLRSREMCVPHELLGSHFTAVGSIKGHAEDPRYLLDLDELWRIDREPGALNVEPEQRMFHRSRDFLFSPGI